MKKILFLSMVLFFAFASTAIGFETQVVGVVNGTISATGSYRVFSGINPALENQAAYNFYGKGTLGLSDRGVYAGSITNAQQLEVADGFGRFTTKVGTGSLVTSTNEETGEVTGVLNQNAIGFGGFMTSGVAATGFDTNATGGFTGIAQAEGIGTFRAGAVGQTIIGGTTTDPVTTERTENHWVFGPGQYQVQVQIIFPKAE